MPSVVKARVVYVGEEFAIRLLRAHRTASQNMVSDGFRSYKRYKIRIECGGEF